MKKKMITLIIIQSLLFLLHGCLDFFPEEKITPNKKEEKSSPSNREDDFFYDHPVYHEDWEEEE